MKLTFDGSPHIQRLSERWHGVLQVLLPEFTLTKGNQGLLLEVTVTDDLPSIVDSEGKRQFFQAVMGASEEGKKSLVRSLTRFFRDERLLSYRFDCSAYPLRYGNGGVLPIIRLDSEDYFCLFYRDVFPIGWTIANGSSDTLEEMLDPERIIHREFGEELFIADHEKGLIYAFEPGDETAPPGFQREALLAWKEKFRDFEIDRYKRLSIPIKWLTGPDRVRALVGKRTHTSDGYFLSITPEDNAIEVDRIALINLKHAATFFDGEYSRGVLYNRVVGLFRVSRMRRALEGSDFRPDRVFFNGIEGKPEELKGMIKEYLQAIDDNRTGADKQEYDEARDKFDLCPITHAIIRRYFEWVEDEKSYAKVPIQAKRDKEVHAAENCEIFISFKHDDLQIARWLYDHLSKCRYRAFCSVESLVRLGAADYCKAIDRALESASCLIVLGTRADHFDSGWVGYEWRSFINEIHSGRKAKGRVFIFASDVSIGRLPFALRSFQMIPYSPSSPQDSFEDLVRYIGQPKNSLPIGD